MDNTREALTILSEECAEVIQIVSKILRYGTNSSHPKTPGVTNQALLNQELGDVAALVEKLTKLGIANSASIETAKTHKLEALKVWSGIGDI